MLFRYPNNSTEVRNMDYLLNQMTLLSEEVKNFILTHEVKFADPIEWNPAKYYPLYTIVLDSNTGDSYLAIQNVPAGISLNDTKYWQRISSFNAQLESILLKIGGIHIKSDAEIGLIKDDESKAAYNATKIMEAFQAGYGVFLTNGTYYCNTITMKNGDVLIGENKIKTKIKNTFSNGIELSLALDEMYKDSTNKIWSNFTLSNLSIITDDKHGYGLYIKNKTFEDDANSDVNEYERIVGHLYGFELRNSITDNLYINGFATGFRVGGFINTGLFNNFFIENCGVGCEMYGSDSKFTNFNITFCSYGFNLDGPFNTINTSKIYNLANGAYAISGSYGLNIGQKAYSSFIESVDIQECGEVGCSIINAHGITLNICIDSCGLTGNNSTGIYINNCYDIIGNVKTTNLRNTQNKGIIIENSYNMNINYSEEGQITPLSNEYARLLNTPISSVTIYKGTNIIGHATANYSEIKFNFYFTADATIVAGTDLFDISLLNNKSVQILVPGSDNNIYTLYNAGTKMRCFTDIPNGVSLFGNTVSEYSAQ